jgi:predicted dinucleotide-binding enzyme
VPRAHVVSAFSTAPGEVLLSVYERRRRKTRPSLVYVDVGRLSAARYVEPFSLLLAAIAYEGSHGPKLAYRFEWPSSRKR